ncbi:MAG: flagellar hook-basal body complex protein [Arcobacter sp.]|nr:flagellar hook-basal body complex protein [Arcobacter sp.]
MIGALWTGISGLASHQSALDNESHNIANVNTVGYKASRISFADQMYQDRIGKGSKILDAEKLYVQGNLKLTGVDYDMALSGDGFFTVLNTRSSGSAETLFTRAGNFRMGDNGTLQDAAGNEVQGWAMRSIDTANDVTSTNPNVEMFTSDYSKLLTSKVVQHSNYIETITAKSTDYAQIAQADSSKVFEGAGAKSKSAKISDVEALVSDYSSWLNKLKNEPDGGSASSTAQISQINFKSYSSLTGPDNGLISKEGDQIYVFIDGTKYSQNYVSVTTTENLNSSGGVDDTDHKMASRIATYKALADKISEIPGLRAYMASESTGGTNDVLEDGDSFTLSTKNADMIKGIIQIESLIPGKSFTITEVAEVSGNNSVAGAFQTGTPAVSGTGVGALVSARDALSEAITGKQQDVYSITDLGIPTATEFTYAINIYDKASGKSVPVPGNSSTTPDTPYSISMTGINTIDAMVDAINGTTAYSYLNDKGNTATTSSYELSDYIVAKNINGHLVIETTDKNFDVEYNSSMKYNIAETAAIAGTNATVNSTFATADIATAGDPNSINEYTYTYNLGAGEKTINIVAPSDKETIANAITSSDPDLTATLEANGDIKIVSSNGNFTASSLQMTGSTAPIDKNNDYSGRQGAGAEFIELINTIDQSTTQSSLQLKLDTLGISDSAFGEFSVDSTGLITMKQDGADFAIGQVSIALFNNNRGLDPSGDNLLAKTNDSGEPIYNLNNDKTAKIEGQTLELSTADLSESLVNLMVFQRAFEANAKSITTSDQLLNTLINLKR